MHALTIAAALVLVVSGRAQAEPSSCDTPAASRTLSVPLPGSPFMTVVTRDGCWVFASLAGGQKPGLAVLRRAGGRIELFRTVPVRGGLTGLVLTHDGELLIGTDGEGVVMMTVKRLIAAEQQDPLVATIHGMAGAVYANVTSDDELLFVSNERARSISVIDLGKARSSARRSARSRWGMLRWHSDFLRMNAGSTPPARVPPPSGDGRQFAIPKTRAPRHRSTRRVRS
jgi:hypothetical protein